MATANSITNENHDCNGLIKRRLAAGEPMHIELVSNDDVATRHKQCSILPTILISPAKLLIKVIGRRGVALYWCLNTYFTDLQQKSIHNYLCGKRSATFSIQPQPSLSIACCFSKDNSG